MQRTPKIFLIAVLTVVLSFPPLSNAQTVRLGPQVGMQKAQDADNARLLFGGALRMKLLPILGAEGSINYRHQEYFDGAITVRNWPVMATGLLYVLPFVYGAAGMGFYHTTIDYSAELNELGLADNTKQKVGWHVGGGGELPLGPRAKLTGDIRYVFLDLDFQEIQPRQDRQDLNSNFYMITAGILFDL